MKKLIVVLTIMLSAISLFAEEDTISSSSSTSSNGQLAFSQGDNIIGLGIDVHYNAYGDILDVTPGVGFLWDHGAFNDMFSVGIGVNAAFYGDYSYLSPSFRFGFHPFGLPPLKGKLPTELTSVLDPYVVAYGGLSIGLGVDNIDVVDVLYPWFGASLGVRWMFKPAVGLMAEGDWNHALIGFVFKF
jgi:hypothetical protein